MSTANKLKIFNDPIYGFIRIPNPLVFDLIAHPYVQRLRRISQMGLSYLVYPGAHHTRFHHALGCVHLMQKSIQVLRFKGVVISEEEEQGLLCAILLHDIGHGPFSHAMEHSIVEGLSHEYISVAFMKELNTLFNGSLTVALSIFTGKHEKKFLNQLISSQLDVDRLDYLKRDSFYSGVAEGNTNSDRLISMLNVCDGQLVVEEKGIYSVEKFLMARRFMYWQTYLHKTGVVAEQLLMRILKRARAVIAQGDVLWASTPLMYFLTNTVDRANFNTHTLKLFAQLDDVDIFAAIKEWQHAKDYVLSELCSMMLNRRLLHIKIKKTPISATRFDRKFLEIKDKLKLSDEETSYFVFKGTLKNKAYDRRDQNINILRKNGKVADVAKLSDNFNLNALAKTVTKYYICYPKDAV